MDDQTHIDERRRTILYFYESEKERIREFADRAIEALDSMRIACETSLYRAGAGAQITNAGAGNLVVKPSPKKRRDRR